jgi:hypothetical protein
MSSREAWISGRGTEQLLKPVRFLASFRNSALVDFNNGARTGVDARAYTSRRLTPNRLWNRTCFNPVMNFRDS